MPTRHATIIKTRITITNVGKLAFRRLHNMVYNIRGDWSSCNKIN